MERLDAIDTRGAAAGLYMSDAAGSRRFAGFGAEAPRFGGSVPTLITPFTPDSQIDWPALDRLVEWHIASGCTGLFSPCLSSEMFQLSADERLALAQRVHSKAAGRCAVLATGTYGGSVEEMAACINEMAKCCDAVVVVTAFLAAEDDDDEVWLANAQRLLDLTPGVPLGTYECPVPYKRLLSPHMMRWLRSSGRFRFHKDTCCDLAQINAKLVALSEADESGGGDGGGGEGREGGVGGDRGEGGEGGEGGSRQGGGGEGGGGGGGGGGGFSVFNANVETLLPSLLAGAQGFSGISANFYPHLHSWLCEHARLLAAGAPERSEAGRYAPSPLDAADTVRALMQRVQDFLSLAEATVCVLYPHSAKAYLALYARQSQAAGPGGREVVGKRCRNPAVAARALAPHQREALAAMMRMQRELSLSLGITEIDPSTGLALDLNPFELYGAPVAPPMVMRAATAPQSSVEAPADRMSRLVAKADEVWFDSSSGASRSFEPPLA